MLKILYGINYIILNEAIIDNHNNKSISKVLNVISWWQCKRLSNFVGRILQYAHSVLSTLYYVVFTKNSRWNNIFLTHTVRQCFLLLRTEILPSPNTYYFFSRSSMETNKLFVFITNMCIFQYRTQDSPHIKWSPLSTIMKNVKSVMCEWMWFDMMYNVHRNIRW